MKIYKHDKYDNIILLAYPRSNVPDSFYGIPYFYFSITDYWERAGLGTALYYYDKEKLDTMDCIGDTDVDWELVMKIPGAIDSSYLKKRKTNDK